MAAKVSVLLTAANVHFLTKSLLYLRWEKAMRKFMIPIGLLVFFCCFASTGAIAATEHAIPVDPAHGASRHDVILSPWLEDNWTDGPGIFSAAYSDYLSNGERMLSWSDITFEFNLAELAGSRVLSARINVKIIQTWSPDNNNTIPLATLNHYSGSQAPTGNAHNDKLTGTDYLWSFYRLDVNKPFEIDVTSLLKADIAKGHQWAVFSINHVTTAGTGVISAVAGAFGFANLLIVETVPISAIPAINSLLLE